MTGNLLIALPRLKVGILSALLYLSPLSFSQLYVNSTEELHILENTIVVGDVILMSDSSDMSQAQLYDVSNPEKGEMRITAVSETVQGDTKTHKKEETFSKEGKSGISGSESQIVFLPISPESHMTAVVMSSLCALPGSNYQNRIGLPVVFNSGITTEYSKSGGNPAEFRNKVYYREIAIFAIRPPPMDI